MKVGLVINELDVGGAEVILAHLARGLVRAGESVVIFTLQRDGPRIPLPDLSVPIVSMDAGRADPRVVSRLADCLRTHPVDLLHLHLPRAGVVGRLAAQWLRVRPVIYTEHNVWAGYGGFIRQLNKWTIRWNDHIIAVSEQVRKSLIAHGISPQLVTTIPNGIDIDSVVSKATAGPSLRVMLGLGSATPIVGTIGNLHPRKNQEAIIKALPYLRSRWPDLHAVIIGRDEGAKATLLNLAARLGVDRCLHLLGEREDAVALMHEFSVFVLPSKVEGLPVALLEAMALQQPVVVAPVGGIREVIEDGRDGRYASPDDPLSLARVIDALLAQPDWAAELGRSAGERVRRDFSEEAMVRTHILLYERVFERARRIQARES